MEPKFREGQRVMVKPRTEEEANYGTERPEGTVLTPGNLTLIKLDLEFAADGDDLREYYEDDLEEIK